MCREKGKKIQNPDITHNVYLDDNRHGVGEECGCC